MLAQSLFTAILVTFLCNMCTGFLLGARTVPALARRLNSIADDQDAVGHIYQFTGKGPPAEFAKLFGIKSDRVRTSSIKSDRVRTSSTTGVKQKRAKAVPPSVAVVEPVDELEQEVRRKYGGGKKNIDGPLKNASSSQTAVVGFDRPQQREAKQEKRPNPVSREEMMQKWESSRAPSRGAPNSVRKTTTSLTAHATARDKLESVSPTDFRLRPPPPIDPEQLAKTKAKERMLAEKTKQFEQTVKMQREKNKEMFTPFHFKLQLTTASTEQDESALQSEDSGLFSDSGFEALGIADPVILKNLEEMQVLVPTQIQALAIPALLQARQNVILQAQTGSGKTLAYLLPLIDSVDTTKKQVQVLILAPSRELVQQIGQVACALFADTLYKTVTLIGGANVQNQLKHLREDRPQIVIATPGRLAEIVFELEKLRLGGVHTVVIDEVDQMLQEPYVGEVETLLQATPFVVRKPAVKVDESRSTDESSSEASADAVTIADGAADHKQDRHLLCLVSATSHDPAVTAFADRYQTHRSARVSASPSARTGIASSDVSSDSDSSTSRSSQPTKSLKIAASGGAMLPRTITHGLISTPRMRSLEFLKRFLNARPAVQRALIFVNDPRRVEGVVKELGMAGIIAAPLHGDTSKDDRKEILMRLKDGRLKLVVATELAARGLDIPELTHVINYELPTDAEHYVHRTGRCGRAGREGLVMNFVNPDTKFVVRRFGKKLGIKVLDCEIRDNKVFLKRV